jgi:hypothetical protein
MSEILLTDSVSRPKNGKNSTNKTENPSSSYLRALYWFTALGLRPLFSTPTGITVGVSFEINLIKLIRTYAVEEHCEAIF